MIVYRVEFYTEENCSEGFGWFTSRKEAQKYVKEFEANNPGNKLGIEQVVIHTTKKDLLRALLKYASHPDNG